MCIATVLSLTAVCRASEPAALEAAGGAMRTVRNLSYVATGAAADPQRSLDLYLPKTVAPAKKGGPPLFVYIHGGAWISGDKRQYGPLGLALSSQGVAVAIINYRLSGDGPDGVRHPAHVKDAAAAVAFLRKHAEQYGYDANRIFVGGHSAGGYMSALLAYDGGLLSAVGERPEAMRGYVGIEGIYDLNELVHRFPSYRVDFLQTAFGSDEAAWRTASPQNLIGGASKTTASIAHLRPWLLIHTKEDELVDVEQSRRFHKALLKLGAEVRMVTPERGSHFSVIGELATPESPLCQQLLAFLLS